MNLKTKQQLDNFLGKAMVAFHLPVVKTLGKLLGINHKLQEPPREILIIKMLGFGSLLLSTDALLALKKKYPNAKLTLIGTKGIEEGARLLNLFDHYVIIDDRSFFKLLKTSFKVVFYCMSNRNKWCFDFEVYSRLTTLFALYTFSKNRFGFEFEKVNFRNYLNTHNTYFNHFVPTEENYNAMVHMAGAEVNEQYVLLNETQNKTEKNCIVINNTCSTLSLQRKLDYDQLINLIEELTKNGHDKIVLLGAPNDQIINQNLIESLLAKTQKKVENWAGKFNFEELIKQQAIHAKAIITIDSAPLHIAARLNIPMVAIWGPTQSQTLAPTWLRDRNNYVEINHHVHCSPCVHHTKELPCKGNNFCIKEISTQEIIQSLEHILNEGLS